MQPNKLTWVLLMLSVTCANTAMADKVGDIYKFWQSSAHANAASDSFRHWDKDGAIPESCAACHSETGFLDFIGADGSAAGKVDQPADTNTVVGCQTCHNSAVDELATVRFPSGADISAGASTTQCMICHQGRASTVQLNSLTDNATPDEILEDTGFVNIHYVAAAATFFGTEAKAGYEYKGKDYVGHFQHVPGFNGCVDCHSAHALSVKQTGCSGCHSNGSYGLARQNNIGKLQQALVDAIIRYSTDKLEKPIGYDSANYPYFFVDSDSSGQLDAEEARYPNRVRTWTPRLLRAAYNYHFSKKEPGAYAHNGKYMVQLLYDSLADIGGQKAAENTGVSRP